jgi:hypothetical protein
MQAIITQQGQQQQIQALIQSVHGAHSTTLFIGKLNIMTRASSANSNAVAGLGLVYIPNGDLLIHSRLLGNAFGIKSNSLNRNLRNHGFQCVRRNATATQIQHLGVQLPFGARCWSLWRSTIAPFNGFLTANQLSAFTDHARDRTRTPGPAVVVTAPLTPSSAFNFDSNDSDEDSWIFW